ncbi:MAG: response regulator transcription factor [Flavobacteriales bacterium]|nr:response regulator transcription factor [Flavobacteriales bacterium]
MEYRNVGFVIADDQSIVKYAIKSILSKDPEFKLLGEAENFEDVYDLVVNKKPDILITEIYLKGDTAIQYIQRLKRMSPLLKIIVLSDKKIKKDVSDLYDAGISSYLLKICQVTEVSKAIKKVIKGERYFLKEVWRTIQNSETSKNEDSNQGSKKVVSERELQILKLIAKGQTSSQIGVELKISARTVDAHRSNMMAKLGVKNAAELLGLAYRNQILTPRSQ